MSDRQPGAERAAENAHWREAVAAHFALAGHLASAALSLELVATLLDEDGDWLYGELAEILPAERSGGGAPASDREFILDRAQTHREKAELFAANGTALAEALANSLRRDVGVPDSWERRDELCTALRPYAEAIDTAAADAERALGALDASVSKAGESEPATMMADVVRFLNLEAALFAKLLEP